MKKYSVLVALLLLSLPFLSAQTILNTKLSTADDYIIVSYDLKGTADKIYDVKLHFMKDDSTKLVPKALNGDVGKVEAGSGKTIVWDLYKDVDGISGVLDPILEVKEIVVDTNDKVQDKPTPSGPSKIVDVLTNQVNKNKEIKKVRFGLKVGTGKSSVRTEQRSFFYNDHYSFAAGPFVRWNVTKRFYLQPEILFQQQYFDELLSAEEKITHQRIYGRGQLVAGIGPLPGFHFNFGAYYGRLLSGNEYDDLVVVSQNLNNQSLKPSGVEELPFKVDDVGYLLGGSVSVAQGWMTIGWLYSQGFNSFVDGDYMLGEQSITNQSLVNKSIHFFIQKSF